MEGLYGEMEEREWKVPILVGGYREVSNKSEEWRGGFIEEMFRREEK